MSTERELRMAQDDKLFDAFLLKELDEAQRQRKIDEMIAKAKSGMTKEEIAEVSARVMDFVKGFDKE